MDTRTLNCTPAQLQSLATAIAAHGIVIDPSKPSGECVDGSWDVSYVYNGSTALTIDLKKHPWGADSIFWGRINGMLG